jgi:hypothetical protein
MPAIDSDIDQDTLWSEEDVARVWYNSLDERIDFSLSSRIGPLVTGGVLCVERVGQSKHLLEDGKVIVIVTRDKIRSPRLSTDLARLCEH